MKDRAMGAGIAFEIVPEASPSCSLLISDPREMTGEWGTVWWEYLEKTKQEGRDPRMD